MRCNKRTNPFPVSVLQALILLVLTTLLPSEVRALLPHRPCTVPSNPCPLCTIPLNQCLPGAIDLNNKPVPFPLFLPAARPALVCALDSIFQAAA